MKDRDADTGDPQRQRFAGRPPAADGRRRVDVRPYACTAASTVSHDRAGGNAPPDLCAGPIVPYISSDSEKSSGSSKVESMRRRRVS
jgi:hypothetical protein